MLKNPLLPNLKMLMKTSTSDDLTPSELRCLAVDLLARREYSRLELFRKLSSRTRCEDQLNTVLDDLSERGWQSDQRYAALFVRSKASRGIGALRLKQELRLKGVTDSLAKEALRDADIDWFELAVSVARKKYATVSKHDKWREKLYRFLMYRGFDGEQIEYALGVIREDQL